jgi:hypothetical protein
MNTVNLEVKISKQEVKPAQSSNAEINNELMFSHGISQSASGRLEVRLGKTKEEMQKVIATLYSSL